MLVVVVLFALVAKKSYQYSKDNLKKFLTVNKIRNKSKIVDAIFNETDGLLAQPNTPMFTYYAERFKVNFPEFANTRYCDRYLRKVETNVFNPHLGTFCNFEVDCFTIHLYY